MSALSVKFDIRRIKGNVTLRFLRRMALGFFGVAVMLWFVARIESINSQRGIESSRATGLSSQEQASYISPMLMRSVGPKLRFAQISAAQKTYLIARSVSIRLSVGKFVEARVKLDRIVKTYSGTIVNMTISNPKSASQTLSANVAIPAAQCDMALEEFKKLGRIEEERQSSEDVTDQSENLDIRLRSSHMAEGRLNDILRMGTDKVGDVLEVEKELARVREEIEQMEAEQKGLNNRVAFASIDLSLTEEYQSQLSGGRSFVWLQIRNALVDGYSSAADSFVSILVFLLSVGPSLIIWGALLFWPARWAWRRWRKPQTDVVVGA
jgi:Domain of unknown function (DUF4349)